MNAAYQHLALADVKPGMILSDQLLDPQGQVLLPANTVLTAATIALLPHHGISALAVLRDGAGTPGPARTDDSVIERRLAKLFRKNELDDNDDWATGILRRYIADYRLDREIVE